MSLKVVERRQKLLSLHSRGLTLQEVVKQLSSEYGVTARAVYYDWSRRRDWMEGLLDLKDKDALLLDVVANHKELYRLANFEYRRSQTDAARIGALRLIRDLDLDFIDFLVTRSLVERVEVLEASK